MAQKESNILKKIMLGLSGRAVLFRNNRGVLKVGARVTRYGVGPNGASDLIGWQSITVTPDMVGKRVAIFTAIEVKTETGTVAPEQSQFIASVLDAGGLAGIARSVEEAEGIIKTPTG